jgi:hypothetical protein
MNYFKKQFLIFLFALTAGLFLAGNASAQTWSAVFASVQNPCGSGSPMKCACPQGYSFGTAHNANCTMDGFIPGCWNPGSGTCNTCGQGGTVELGANGCFNNGQANVGGTNPPIQGIGCIQNTSNPQTNSVNWAASTQCIGSGTTSGGFSTN